MSWIDLGNGVRYNQQTGAAEYIDQETGEEIYKYDPTSQHTYYGGQKYVGRYDPWIIGGMTDEDFTKRQEEYEPWLDEAFDRLSKNHFLQDENDHRVTAAMNSQQHMSFNAAYWDALERTKQEGGQSFFDYASGLGAQESAGTGQQPTESQPSLPSTPQEPDSSSQFGNYDWGALYDQISNYFMPQQQQAGKPREQIGSFQQYGPTISQRQQSYISSTPYSGKGA
jgi:hypothetical protein